VPVGGGCPVHGRARQPDQRTSAAARGYDSTWAKLARKHRAAHPECAWCGGAGQLVDHVVPLTQGGARLHPANLQTLCRSCHTIKTRAEQRPNTSPTSNGRPMPT